jgi:hypothetical protein
MKSLAEKVADRKEEKIREKAAARRGLLADKLNPNEERKPAMLDLVSRTKGTFLAPREVIKQIEMLLPEAVTTIEDLMRNAKSETVRLKAAVEVLELGGVSKETRLTIKTDVKDMSEREINERLHSLMGLAGKTYLEGDYEEIEDE